MKDLKDLQGKRFGKLTVLEKTVNPNSKSRKIYWLCRCDCGNQSIVNTSALLRGDITQCWECAHKQTNFYKRKNVMGKRFGKLVVTNVEYGVVSASGKKRTYCTCKCDCGRITRRSLDSLKEGSLCSCGCARKEIASHLSKNVIGRKFGRLTVVGEDLESVPRKLICVCDCGSEYVGIKTDIMSNHTRSCGCLQREATSSSNTKDWTGFVSNFGVEMISPYKKNKRGQWLWECKCPCGNKFYNLPAYIKSGHVTSCGCREQSSREQFIYNFLNELGVDFEREVTFEDCVYIQKLPFDFGIKDKSKTYILLIEYDGRQHFQAVDYFGGEKQFSIQKIRDDIKNKYCLNNKIPLLRLDYTQSENEIKQIILNTLNP